MKVQDCQTGMQIGFANEFFTLWNVEPADQYGVQQAWFCGNISKDKDLAKAKYPNLPFTGIKGYELNFTPSPKDDGTAEVFMFGKHVGQPFEVAQSSYLKWYWEETRNVNALATLLDRGFVLANDTLFASEAAATEWKNREAVRTQLQKDGTHQVICRSNISISKSWSCETDEVIDLFISVNIAENDNHLEEYPYGQSLRLSDAIEFSTREYKGIQYGVLNGMRSMKERQFEIQVKSGVIISIKSI